MTESRSHGPTRVSPSSPCGASVQLCGVSGRFCSCAKPRACPNSCTAIAWSQNMRLDLQSGLQLLYVKLRTIPPTTPSRLRPSAVVCGPSSEMMMWMPEENGVHVPHPVKVTYETEDQVFVTAVSTQLRAVALFALGLSQHTGMLRVRQILWPAAYSSSLLAPTSSVSSAAGVVPSPIQATTLVESESVAK